MMVMRWVVGRLWGAKRGSTFEIISCAQTKPMASLLRAGTSNKGLRGVFEVLMTGHRC